MLATGETVGLAEWIIDDTCLVVFIIRNMCLLTVTNWLANGERRIIYYLFNKKVALRSPFLTAQEWSFKG